jgi:hypothetical protein
MALATKQITGNNSGPYLRRPKIVVMHATRSGIASKTDAQELSSTLNWFTNPDGASSHWVISEKERVRVVTDDLIAWHSAYLNARSWGIELTQPTIDRPFRDGHYANAALVGQHYVALGVAPVWLPYWDGGDASGFVAHQDTQQGLWLGKSDPGPEFDRVRFISSLEDEMILVKFSDKGGTVYIPAGGVLIRLAAGTWPGMKALGFTVRDIKPNEPDLKLRAIRNWPKMKAEDLPGTGGYSDAKAVKAVKDKL